MSNDPNDFADVDSVMQYFAYDHLPEHLQVASKPFAALAIDLVNDAPSNAQRTLALNKLLEAKDAAVRAYLTPG